MKRTLVPIALLLCLGVAPAQTAQTHRLDDSLSHVVPPDTRMRWLPLARTAGGQAMVEAWVRVNVRIDTRAWAGRQGRVYMVLPRDEASSIEAQWTTQGRLLAGRLVSGERALVHAGPIPGPTLDDQLTVRLRSGADWQSDARRLSFHFELDTD